MSRPGWTGEFGVAVAVTVGLMIASTAGVGLVNAQPRSAPVQAPTQEAPPKSDAESGKGTDGEAGALRGEPKKRPGREKAPPAGCPTIGDKLELLV
jgi:hypothetical protein